MPMDFCTLSAELFGEGKRWGSREKSPAEGRGSAEEGALETQGMEWGAQGQAGGWGRGCQFELGHPHASHCRTSTSPPAPLS